MSPSRAHKLHRLAVEIVARNGWPEGSWRRLHRNLKRFWIRNHATPRRVRRIGSGDDARFVLEGGAS